MNALVKKEIRLLLPNFIFAVVLVVFSLGLALASILFDTQPGSWVNGFGYFLGYIICPAIVVMLALNSFGVEVGTQTFPLLLAQPVKRLRIWQMKITTLALAMAAVGLIWYVSVFVPALYHQRAIKPEDWADMQAAIVLFGMVVFSGALWTVLLLRQVAAAFWFTLIVPGALLAIVAACCSGASDEFILGMIATVLGLYSVAGFFFARWLFFRAQDLQWTGGAIVMPELRGLARFRAAAGALRMWRPRAALWKKEMLLQQSQFVVAFSLAVLHLGVLAVREFCDLHNSPDLLGTLEGLWVVWLVMPLLVGCAAVAEERKLGTHEGQLCLPAKRRTQFLVKFLVVLGLSLLFGALMPTLLEAKMFLSHFTTNGSFHDSLELLILPGIAALTGAVSFYISTMARNTLQTLAPAVLGATLVWPLIFATAASWNDMVRFLWSGPLGCYIVLPIFALTLLALAYKNFQSILTGWNLSLRNVLTLLSTLALGVMITSATYHRFWEKLTPFEPRHGAARLSLSNPASIIPDWGVAGLTVRLPDARIWTGLLTPRGPVNPKSLSLRLGNFKVQITDGKYVPGTNWLSVKHSYWITAGLKRDGTLWVSKNPPGFAAPENRWKMNADVMYDLAQFGSESNWTSFLPRGDTLLLTKKDGTLWRLGQPWPHSVHGKTKPWPGLLAFTPQRVGTESNWAEVFQSSYQICFRKTDGTVWITGNWTTNGQPRIEIEPDLVVYAAPPLDRGQMRSTAMITHGLAFQVGIQKDGTFRIWADERPGPRHGSRREYEWCLTDRQIGAGTNWLAVTENGDKAVTLKDDGTLWLWNFRLNPIRGWDPDRLEEDVIKAVPVRLGTHSDWIAISGDTALAADGSLWFWPLMDASRLADLVGLGPEQNDNQRWQPLLDISRKPQLLGNVFSAAN